MADDDLNTTLRWPGAPRLRAATSPTPAPVAAEGPVDEVDVLGRLRALEGLLESLRGDVVGIRSSLLHLPDARSLDGLIPLMEGLAQVQTDAAHTRDEVGAIAAAVRDLAEEIRAMPAVADSVVLRELREEVATLRGEVTQLRRRIAVRARPEEP
jgi:hypothetical protein